MHRIVNVLLVAGILGSIFLVVHAGMTGNYHSAASATFALLFVYSIIVVALLVVVLLIHAVAVRTVAYLKWPFVLFVLAYLVVLSASSTLMLRLSGADTVHLRVLNESGAVIERVDVFGRGDLVSIARLQADSGEVRAFRGRLNNYKARDYYSNRVAVTWYARGRWRERVLVHEDVVIGDSMVIVFPSLDSVQTGATGRPLIAR
jgi:hypothetical protein